MDPSQFVNSAPEPPTTADLEEAVIILKRVANAGSCVPVGEIVGSRVDETRNACQRVATFLAHLAPMMDMLRGVLGGSADPNQIQNMMRGML